MAHQQGHKGVPVHSCETEMGLGSHRLTRVTLASRSADENT